MSDRAGPIAITGFGLVSAAGADTDRCVAALAQERCALRPLPADVADGLAMRTGGRIPLDVLPADVDPRDRARLAAGRAIDEALASARIGNDRRRVGLALGTGLGPVGSGTEPPRALADPSAVVGRVGELAPHALTRSLATRFELGGPRSTFAATCVSASYALEEARAALAHGRADHVLCGGIDVLGRFIQAGFCRLGAFEAILSNDGFVLGEAAAFVVLERLDDAVARGAVVQSVLCGHALHADSSHLISPDEDGRGMSAAIEAALAEAGLEPDDVARVSVSAVASPKYAHLYDRCLARVFGTRAVERRTWEPCLGHVLAASGALGLGFAGWHLGGRLERAPDGHVLVLTVGFGGQNGAAVVGPAAGTRDRERTRSSGVAEPRARLCAVGVSRGGSAELERQLGGRWDARRALEPSVRTLVDAVRSALESAGWWTPGDREPVPGGLIVGTDFASLSGFQRFARTLERDATWTRATDFLFALPSTGAAVVGLALGLEEYQATLPAEGASAFAAVVHAVERLQLGRLERCVVAAHTRIDDESSALLGRGADDGAEPFDLAVAWCLEADRAGARGPRVEVVAPGDAAGAVATSARLDDVPAAWIELAGPALLGATRWLERTRADGRPRVVRHRDSCLDETGLIRLRPSP